MADGSISGNSGKAVEESEEMTWFFFSRSPTYFPSPPLHFTPSPPQEFPWSSPPPSPPPSSNSRPELPLASDGSQPPMENPMPFLTETWAELPLKVDDSEDMVIYGFLHDAVSFGWTPFNLTVTDIKPDGLDFSLGTINSRGEQSIPIPREGLNIVVRQRHGGDRLTEIRRPRHRLCTFDNAEEVALAFDQAGFKLRGENARLNFPFLFLDQNRAAESTAPPRTEFPPTPAQHRNPEEDPGSGRSEAMAAAADNEVEGLGWGSGTGKGERRKILERENKKTRGVRITIPLEDIQKYSKMKLKDAAINLNVSRSTFKRICREYDIDRWPPRSNIMRRIPQLNSNDWQLGPSNQASSSTVVHTNQSQLSYAEKQLDTDSDTEKRLSSFKQPNDGNIVTVKARCVNDLTIKFPMPWPSSGLVELEQQVAKRLNLEAGTYHIKYKDEEDELILIACDEDFQDYVCVARLKGTSSITVFLEPK